MDDKKDTFVNKPEPEEKKPEPIVEEAPKKKLPPNVKEVSPGVFISGPDVLEGRV